LNTKPNISQLPIYCVYRHVRPDKQEPFYIGIGDTKRSKRPFNRNKYWENIYELNCQDIEIDILHENLTWEQAVQQEIWWIAFYGRWDTGKGPLVNMTDGGEGTVGAILSKEHRANIAKANLGNLSNTGKIRITNGIDDSFITAGDLIPDGWRKGGKKRESFSLETCQRFSEQRKGRKLQLSDTERNNRSQRAIGNKAASGKKWINNGYRSLYIEQSMDIPTGWKAGRVRTWINQFEKQKLNSLT